MKRPTIRDVAAASGVSPATVSFVLNQTPEQTISATTQRRVIAAAEQLGYRPNGLARALAEGTSRIVVLNVDSRLHGNYARSYIAGLDDELSRHGHVLLVRHDHPREDDPRVLHAIHPRAVLQFGGIYQTGHELEDSGGGWRDGLAAHAALQIRYLAEHGHEHIAFALPARDAPLAEIRLRFSNETARALRIPPLCVVTLPSDRDAAADALAALRVDAPSTTAIAAFDDATALRALGAARAIGLEVPRELAVIGYDDAGFGQFTTPALTTIHIDAEAHGRMSAREALGLDHADLHLTPGSVMIRESV